MKKKILMLLTIAVLFSTAGYVSAKQSATTELSALIKMYKAGNYSECYVKLTDYVKKDPANALAYYYLAMTSAQIGKKSEAISNYDKVLTLTSPNGNLGRYATKGKTCLETPNKCQDSTYASPLEEFIRSKNTTVTDEVRSDYERLKIENMMREINRNENIPPQEFKEYKDFSSVPTNDEIVAALRTLQRAGFSDIFSNNYQNDLSLITGYQNPQQNNQIMNMLGNSSMNPQLIQALLTNNMSLGF